MPPKRTLHSQAAEDRRAAKAPKPTAQPKTPAPKPQRTATPAPQAPIAISREEHRKRLRAAQMNGTLGAPALPTGVTITASASAPGEPTITLPATNRQAERQPTDPDLASVPDIRRTFTHDGQDIGHTPGAAPPRAYGSGPGLRHPMQVPDEDLDKRIASELQANRKAAQVDPGVLAAQAAVDKAMTDAFDAFRQLHTALKTLSTSDNAPSITRMLDRLTRQVNPVMIEVNNDFADYAR